MTDAETISLRFCFSLVIVFRFIAVTTTGGILTIFFEDVKTWISFGESAKTSNLHQLTRWGTGRLENFEIDSHEGPFIFLLTRKVSKALQKEDGDKWIFYTKKWYALLGWCLTEQSEWQTLRLKIQSVAFLEVDWTRLREAHETYLQHYLEWVPSKAQKFSPLISDGSGGSCKHISNIQ